MATKNAEATPSTSLGLEDELASRQILDRLQFPFGSVEIVEGKDSLWIVVDIRGKGGYAIRASHLLGNHVTFSKKSGDRIYEVGYPAGTVRVEILGTDCTLRVRTWIKPTERLILPYAPRDFFLLDAGGNPGQTKGKVHTAQAGMAAPIVYLTLTTPKVGSFLYFQNLTELNPYFALTETSPEGSVGGRWPEFGYLLPTSFEKSLPARRETLVKDTIVAFDPRTPTRPKETSEVFLDLVAEVYPLLTQTKTKRHDWQRIAEKSLRDMAQAPTASVTYRGCKYLRPYNDAEYPDSMIQANVLHGLVDFQKWKGVDIPLAAKLEKGLGHFFDKKLKTVRRYLPNVGEDKNADEVDSWYMYHPLKSLARLARHGSEIARKLFFDSIDRGIEFAHKFDYRWPVMFDIKTGEVIREERREGEDGQSDVAGLYAYVMMEAFDLCQEERYLEEAKKAMAAIAGLSFEIAYQLNTTAWGVPACVRLWKATGEYGYVRQAMVFLAAFVRHTIFWESDIKLAKNFSTFLAVLCLDDTRYMAQFECHESFEAFWETMSLARADLPDSALLFMSDYCKHALHRACYYYPQYLPKDALSKEIRNGKIDCSLYFPVEDLYPGGDPAGKIGQEIYGCGAAFAFTTNAYHRLDGAPFTIFCEYPICVLDIQAKAATFEIAGSSSGSCALELMPRNRQRGKAILSTEGRDRTLEVGSSVQVRGNQKIVLRWQ